MIKKEVTKEVRPQYKTVEQAYYYDGQGKKHLSLWNAILADLDISLDARALSMFPSAHTQQDATLEAWCENHPTLVELYKKAVNWVEFIHDEERYCAFHVTSEEDVQKAAILIANKYYLECYLQPWVSCDSFVLEAFRDWYFECCDCCKCFRDECGERRGGDYCGYFFFSDRYDHPEIEFGDLDEVLVVVNEQLYELQKEKQAIDSVMNTKGITRRDTNGVAGMGTMLYKEWTWEEGEDVTTETSARELADALTELFNGTSLEFCLLVDRGNNEDRNNDMSYDRNYYYKVDGVAIYDRVRTEHSDQQKYLCAVYPGDTIGVGNGELVIAKKGGWNENKKESFPIQGIKK